MIINKTLNGDTLTVTRPDDWTQPPPSAGGELKDALVGLSALTLDFAELEYISSAGLRVLLSAHKVMSKQGKMVICHVNETIHEVFEVTGFTEILTLA
jgi:anti-sigma B factor antagonist